MEELEKARSFRQREEELALSRTTLEIAQQELSESRRQSRVTLLALVLSVVVSAVSVGVSVYQMLQPFTLEEPLRIILVEPTVAPTPTPLPTPTAAPGG